MTAILEIQNLSKRFGGLHAVERCTFAVKKNSITGLIGPNGAGKTTTFDLISGLLEPDEGKIFYKGEDVTKMPPYKREHFGIGRTFQAIRIFPEMRVIDNILVVLEKRFQKLQHAFFPEKKALREMREKAMEFLTQVHLEDHAHAFAKNLSYGQQKLLEIIRAVATEADLLMLDEPAAGVNPTMLKYIEALIKKLHSEGRAIFIVEHNMPFIMGICEEIIVMDRGKELMIGPPEKVQKNPAVLEAYLGKPHS